MLKNKIHFQEALLRRKQEGILRTLKPKAEGVDFYSNDYLGLAKNREFQKIILERVNENPQLLSGSTGSRLISGNSELVESVENFIAEKHRFQASLLFPSGYNANLALFSTLPTRHDMIIVDEQIHRSVHDACKMSNARKLKFRHNDVEDLESILKKQEKHCYIAIESLYSMEGDLAPIREIAELVRQYEADLIVDEAHAFGVFGNGLVHEYGLQDQITANVITYGKAMGAHGAAILCHDSIKSYMVNFASSFIYTTSAQDFQWVRIKEGYDFLENHQELSRQLQKNINLFRGQGLQSPSSENSPVQAIIIPDHQKLKSLQERLSDEGVLTYAIYSPTVKEGTERLRICLHSFNTEEEIIKLTTMIKSFI